MCMLFIYSNPNAGPNEFSLILANIRDEFLMRPSRQCHFWEKNPEIVGGMDYKEGQQSGTWLAMNTNGKIAALLNVLKPYEKNDVQYQKTRGFLTVDFLQNPFDGPTYLNNISSSNYLNEFDGFIIVTMDVNPLNHQIKVAYLTNLEKQEKPIVTGDYGIFAFGNSLPNEPWKKVYAGKQMFKNIIIKNQKTKYKNNLIKNLFKMMRDDKEYFPDDQLLKDGNGLNESFLRKLSSLYVKMPDILFGSRTHTVILVDSQGNVDYVEKTLQEPTTLIVTEEEKENVEAIEQLNHDIWIKTRLGFRLQYQNNHRPIIPISRL